MRPLCLRQSTLATALAERLGLPVYYEPTTDNVYLADFYKDIKKYSFAMQVRGFGAQSAARSCADRVRAAACVRRRRSTS
jgi:deoxyadenosine/deoxycytidine kinase